MTLYWRHFEALLYHIETAEYRKLVLYVLSVYNATRPQTGSLSLEPTRHNYCKRRHCCLYWPIQRSKVTTNIECRNVTDFLIAQSIRVNRCSKITSKKALAEKSSVKRRDRRKTAIWNIFTGFIISCELIEWADRLPLVWSRRIDVQLFVGVSKHSWIALDTSQPTSLFDQNQTRLRGTVIYDDGRWLNSVATVECCVEDVTICFSWYKTALLSVTKFKDRFHFSSQCPTIWLWGCTTVGCLEMMVWVGVRERKWKDA